MMQFVAWIVGSLVLVTGIAMAGRSGDSAAPVACKLTGDAFGFTPGEPAARNAAAIERFEKWARELAPDPAKLDIVRDMGASGHTSRTGGAGLGEK